MVHKKLLGIAVAGAFSLSGCGLFELAEAIQSAAQDAAAQVKKEVTVQNVKGSINAIGAAMKGLSALQDFSPGPGNGAAPAFLVQAAESEQCSGGGSLMIEEAEDGNNITITADNCSQEDGEFNWFINGTFLMQISGDPDSGNMTMNYTANLEMTTKDSSGAVVESFAFNDLSMEMRVTADQTAGTFSYVYTVNGGFTSTTDTGTNTITYSNFTMNLSAEQGMTSASYSIDGGLSFSLADAACTDGSFTFETMTPLAIGEEDCPTAGVIKVNGVTYTFDGESITATSGNQSETFSCSEVVGDDQCSLGDDDDGNGDGNGQFPDEDTSETF